MTGGCGGCGLCLCWCSSIPTPSWLVVGPIILSEAVSTSGLVESAAEEEPENLAQRVGVGSEDMVVGVESVSGRN
jgi:hypothetical protein